MSGRRVLPSCYGEPDPYLTKLQNDTCKFKSLCCTGTGTAEDIFEVKGLLDNNTVIANCTWISTVQLLR